MRRLPIESYVMMFFLLAIVLSFPLQIVYIYGFESSEFFKTFSMLTKFNYLIMAALIVAIFAWKSVSRSLFVVTPIIIALVAVNNYFVGTVGYDYSFTMTSVATLGFVSLHISLLRPNIRLLLRSPEKRWWLQSPRKRVNVPLEVYSLRDARKKSFVAKDISETGALISTDEDFSDENSLVEGDMLDLRISLGQLRNMTCQARVVRKAGEVKEGDSCYGLEFVNMDGIKTRNMKKFFKHLDV